VIDSDEYIVKRAQECRAIETTFRPVGWPLQPADKWRNGAHRVIATGAHVKGKGRVTANRDTVVARATCHRVAPAAPKIPSAAALQSVKKEKQKPTNGTRLVAKRRRRRVGARSAATTAHHLLSGGDDSTATVEKTGRSVGGSCGAGHSNGAVDGDETAAAALLAGRRSSPSGRNKTDNCESSAAAESGGRFTACRPSSLFVFSADAVGGGGGGGGGAERLSTVARRVVGVFFGCRFR